MSQYLTQILLHNMKLAISALNGAIELSKILEDTAESSSPLQEG